MPRRPEQTWPAAKVEMRLLSSITPYEKNPRTHTDPQIEMIAASMRDDGVTAPILVDEVGVILYGHGRRLAALKNEYEKYPVIVARGLTEQKKRAIRIKDNALALLSSWDASLIQGEVGSLKLSGYDITLLGFPEAQLRGWGITAGTVSENDPEEAPPVPQRVVVRRGDLWLLGEHRLLCGDSTNADDVALCLGGKRPKIMVTDPPYGVDYDPNWRNEPGKLNLQSTSAFKGRKAAKGRVVNDHQSDWSPAWKLFKGDVAYIWHGERQSPEIADHLAALKFDRRNLIVWAKDGLVISRGHYHPQHETCWYMVRAGATAGWKGDRKQSTVWFINRNARNETGHGTQKPIECMRRPIENNSSAGDYVYEPFSGSGTTIIAAQMTGRRCLAIEIDPGYVEVAIERWEKVSGLKARLGAPGGQTLDEVRRSRKPRRSRDQAAPAIPAPARAARSRPRAVPASAPPVPHPGATRRRSGPKALSSAE